MDVLASDVASNHFSSEDTNRNTVPNSDNEPWFFLMNVCNAAGINNARMAKKRLDQEHVSTTDVLAGDNKMRETTIINEAGL